MTRGENPAKLIAMQTNHPQTPLAQTPAAQTRMGRVLAGEQIWPPPVWLMRQAGRYLPEYRETRSRARDFVDFCLSPELAVEATLQPIRRFDLDGAVVFSDILLVPYAMGQDLRFVEGQGPVLAPVTPEDSGKLDAFDPQRLEPVYETLRRLRGDLDPDKALIGFAGGPWTLACYMLQGFGDGHFLEARARAYAAPEAFAGLLDKLAVAVAEHLAGQIEAGADVVQIFESWAGIVPVSRREDWLIRPVERILKILRRKYPQTPVILFPRGLGTGTEAYVRRLGPEGLSMDPGMDPHAIRTFFGGALQGNLDPAALLAGGPALEMETDRMLAGLKNGPALANLGHGVHKTTPPEHVQNFVNRIRNAES